MPPIVLAVLGVAGGVTLATWIVKEARRVNVMLHPEPTEAGPGTSEKAQASGPRLRPDATGIYRPETES